MKIRLLAEAEQDLWDGFDSDSTRVSKRDLVVIFWILSHQTLTHWHFLRGYTKQWQDFTEPFPVGSLLPSTTQSMGIL